MFGVQIGIEQVKLYFQHLINNNAEYIRLLLLTLIDLTDCKGRIMNRSVLAIRCNSRLDDIKHDIIAEFIQCLSQLLLRGIVKLV